MAVQRNVPAANDTEVVYSGSEKYNLATIDIATGFSAGAMHPISPTINKRNIAINIHSRPARKRVYSSEKHIPTRAFSVIKVPEAEPQGLLNSMTILSVKHSTSSVPIEASPRSAIPSSTMFVMRPIYSNIRKRSKSGTLPGLDDKFSVPGSEILYKVNTQLVTKQYTPIPSIDEHKSIVGSPWGGLPTVYSNRHGRLQLLMRKLEDLRVVQEREEAEEEMVGEILEYYADYIER